MRNIVGYPEVITASGTLLLINNQPVAGWVFCAIGLLGVALRFGIKVQEQEQKRKEMHDITNQLQAAGKNILNLALAACNHDKNDLHH